MYLPALVFWMSRTAFKVESMFAWLRNISGGLSFTAGPLIHCFCLFIVPSIVMGMGFPMALQAWANYVHKVGRSTGTAYGANTIGAVIGGVVTGFIFLPMLGVQSSIIILGLLGTWIGAALWFLFYSNASLKRKCALPITAAIFTAIALTIPSDFFGAVVKISPGIPDWQLLQVKEGITTTVSVHRDPTDGSKQLHSSGQSIAGDSYAERGDQKMLGHFGVFLNSKANKILSVGFGSGETTACLAQHNLEQVDCVEIAPEILEVSLKHFTHINLGDKLHDEIKMIFMDAKNYIHLTDTKYDVIVNDSIHPREFAENASLYSKEYFQSAAETLNQDGIIMSWVPTYGMPSSVFVSIIGTLMDVFDHVTMWYPAIRPAPLVLVIGSMQPQNYSVDHIEKEFQKPGVRQSLLEIGIRDSVDVLSCYVGDQNDLGKVIGKFKVNSDYTPFVEFTTDHKTPPDQIFRQFVVTTHSDSIFRHIDWTNFDSAQKDKWLQRFGPARKVTNYLFLAKGSANGLDKLKYSVAGLNLIPKHPALMGTLNDANKLLYVESAKLTKSRRFDDAMNLAENMLKIQPNSAWAWLIKVNVSIEKNDLETALTAAQKAVGADPNNHETHFNLGFVLFKMKRYDQSITAYIDMLNIAEASEEISVIQLAQMMDMLAVVYSAAGKYDEAIVVAEQALVYAEKSGRANLIRYARERLVSLKLSRLKKNK
jgi:spermidine synthase